MDRGGHYVGADIDFVPQTSVKCQEIQVVIVGAEDDVVPAKSGYNNSLEGFSSILLQAILNNFMVAGLVGH